jgi:hypothetical protein
LYRLFGLPRATIASSDWLISVAEMADPSSTVHWYVCVPNIVFVLMLTAYEALVIPYQFVRERYVLSFEQRSPFVKKATPFQDFVIRCVRYAFANMPASIGRVFFSKGVSLPFLRFRMLRHGIVTSPIRWTEVIRVTP